MDGKPDQLEAKIRGEMCWHFREDAESEQNRDESQGGTFSKRVAMRLYGGGATKLGAGYAFAQLAQRHVISFCFGERFFGQCSAFCTTGELFLPVSGTED